MVAPMLGKERKMKVFITGGLRSVGTMVRALGIVDGIGVGSLAAQEPRLAEDILEGRVGGAVRPLALFNNSSGLGVLAAVMQIRQVADGLEPFDLSDPNDVKVLWEVIKGLKRSSEDDGEEVEVVDFPEWTGKVRPYGM